MFSVEISHTDLFVQTCKWSHHELKMYVCMQNCKILCIKLIKFRWIKLYSSILRFWKLFIYLFSINKMFYSRKLSTSDVSTHQYQCSVSDVVWCCIHKCNFFSSFFITLERQKIHVLWKLCLAEAYSDKLRWRKKSVKSFGIHGTFRD